MKNSEKKIEVIVVDDHDLFRVGLKSTFHCNHPDICVVGEADCGESFFRTIASIKADLVLLDVNLPDIGGVEITRRLRRDYPDVKILAVSAENTIEAVNAMVEAGIDGFITKQKSNADELSNAIHTVMSGLEYFGRDIASILYQVYISKKRTTAITPEFTDREREIIVLSSEGLLCKEVADRLGVSFHTVKYHKKNIFLKLGINNNMEMVQYALRNGIIRM